MKQDVKLMGESYRIGGRCFAYQHPDKDKVHVREVAVSGGQFEVIKDLGVFPLNGAADHVLARTIIEAEVERA